MSMYSDKLAHVQVVINCRYSVAQMCTREDTLPHILGVPYFDDFMSYNLLTTKDQPGIQITTVIFSNDSSFLAGPMEPELAKKLSSPFRQCPAATTIRQSFTHSQNSSAIKPSINLKKVVPLTTDRAGSKRRSQNTDFIENKLG